MDPRALLATWDTLTARLAPLLHDSGRSVAAFDPQLPAADSRPETPDLQASSEFIPVSPQIPARAPQRHPLSPLVLAQPTTQATAKTAGAAAWSPPPSPGPNRPRTVAARVPFVAKPPAPIPQPPVAPIAPPPTDPLRQLHGAATLIQAAWRGFRVRATNVACASVRREMRTRRAETHILRLNEEVALLQSRLRAQEELRVLQFEAIKVLWDDVQAMKLAEQVREAARQHRAAAVIQKYWRGRLARKTYGPKLRGRILDALSPQDRRRAAVANGSQHALIDLVLHLQGKVAELTDIVTGAYAGAPWGAAATLRRHGVSLHTQTAGLANATLRASAPAAAAAAASASAVSSPSASFVLDLSQDDQEYDDADDPA